MSITPCGPFYSSKGLLGCTARGSSGVPHLPWLLTEGRTHVLRESQIVSLNFCSEEAALGVCGRGTVLHQRLTFTLSMSPTHSSGQEYWPFHQHPLTKEIHCLRIPETQNPGFETHKNTHTHTPPFCQLVFLCQKTQSSILKHTKSTLTHLSLFISIVTAIPWGW